MKLTVKDKDSHLWDVIDVNTNERIEGVQWVDDNDGSYEALTRDDNGELTYDDKGKISKEVKKGNIIISPKKCNIFGEILRLYCSIKRDINGGKKRG